MESQIEKLAAIVEQVADTVIATTETVEQLSSRMNDLRDQVQQQGEQVLTLTAAVQVLSENQEMVIHHISRLTETLDRIAASLENKPKASA